MNPDTPGAVPSDDLPFLGPAVSPRRRDAGSPLQDTGELAGPFVGGAYARSAEEATPTETEPAIEPLLNEPVQEEPLIEPSSEPAWTGYEASAPAEDEALESFPGADWPSDDFPWLSPSQPEPEPEEEMSEPWRPTADMYELTGEPQGESVDAEADVQHLSWIGEPVSAGEAEPREPEAREPEGYAGASEAAEAEEALDVGAFAPDVVEEERAGFAVDSEPAEESWPRGEGWREAVGEEEDATVAEKEPVLGYEGEFAAPAAGEVAGEDRWEEEVGFQVEEEPQEEPFAEAWRPDREAVEATPLPVGEWETPAAATEPVEEEAPEEEVVVAAAGAAQSDPLAEVADRLEGIARALRSGQPLQGVEQGDPLQLLITGYALGYSQARRGGR